MEVIAQTFALTSELLWNDSQQSHLCSVIRRNVLASVVCGISIFSYSAGREKSIYFYVMPTQCS